jgi:predicted molibdopterin-dependent oxidoreductase YjgC
VRAAVAPPGAARAGWDVVCELLARFEPGLALPSAERVFAALGGETPAFAGLDYDSLGDQGTPAASAAPR